MAAVWLMQHSRLAIFLWSCAILFGPAAAQQAEKDVATRIWTTGLICSEIDNVVKRYKLPRATFTRLIWTESRFDIKAVSPVGAQGIAQFMPATAKEVGLADPFDPGQALEASGKLLNRLRASLGNFGLAAMAYNAGESRVRRWLSGTSQLPFETQDYIAAITGRQADAFSKSSARVVDFSLSKGKSFAEACRELPIIKTRFFGGKIAVRRQPWGVLMAANFSRARALKSWTRIRAQLGTAIGDVKPELHRQKSLRGLKGKWVVRIGAPNRSNANAVCKKIRQAGGFCLVKKSR